MIKQRVFGSETEYGIRIARNGPAKDAPEDQAPFFETPSSDDVIALVHGARPTVLSGLAAPLNEHLYYSNTFLSNGARLYQDCAHPEYATQEVTTLDDIVAAELAGDRILMHFTRQAAASGLFYKTLLSKENTDVYGNSWGYHENYQTLRAAMDPSLALTDHQEKYHLFGTHLLSRCIYAGEGGSVTINSNGKEQSVFAMAPKLMLLSMDIHEGTIQRKPLINVRDESHMSQRFSRQHVVSGGANMNPWGTKMTFGTTQLVLSALEYGLTTAKNIRVKHTTMHEAAATYSQDTSLQAKALTEAGTITAIDMQYEILSMCQRVGEHRTLSQDDKWTLSQWEQVLGKLEADPSQAADRVEWVLKQQLGATSGARARGWTALSETKSMADILRRKYWQQHMPSEERIQHLMVNAPEDTRAAIRARFIQHFGEVTIIEADQRWPHHKSHVGWSAILHGERTGPRSIYEHPLIRLNLSNPSISRSQQLGRLIAERGIL